MALNDSPVAFAMCLMSDTRLSGTFTVKTTFRSGIGTVRFILSASSMYRYACLLETPKRSMITGKASSLEEPSLNRERAALTRSASSACGDLLLICHNYTTFLCHTSTIIFVPIPCISYCLFKLKVIYCVGGVLSPLLSNIVLDELDRELERRGLRFARYADDSNIYVRSRRAGERVMRSIVRFITTKLKLKVNQQKSAVARPWERKFLGFSFTWNREPKRRIAPKAVERFKQRVRELTRRTKGVSIERMAEELAQYQRGWIGYFGRCQTPSVLQGLEEWTRRRLRSVIWKQWKRGTVRFAELRKRGVGKDLAAQTAGSAHGPWRLANSPALTIALPNAYFNSLGIPRLTTVR